MQLINKFSLTSLPSVAIVILNWNGEHFLRKFLPSVLASDYENLSVIVADNDSTDDSVTILQQHFPQVQILQSPVNEGFSKGYNTALKKVTADYYVLLNSDVEVTSGWISPIILLMESNEKIAACQPKILSFNNKQQFEYAGASGGWIDYLGYPFSRGRVFDFCENDNGQYNNAAEIFWATGAALFIRAPLFHEAGGFDEYFFAHQEEIDLCWRLQRMGYKIYAEPAATVYHVGGGTLPMGDRKKIYLNFRNNMVMLAKNAPFSETIWKIPYRIILDTIAAFRALIRGNFSTFISIESAHLDFLKWLIIGKSGKRIHKLKMKSFKAVLSRSVAWEYFINKKCTFLEIVGNKK